MKKSLFLTGMLATVLVLSMAIIGCTPSPDGETDTVINLAEIDGVTPPECTETPVTVIEATAQYTGTVEWSPELENGKFKAATVYTATITLTAKSGYTLQGVTANFFTVQGATATNPANSGIIVAVFPATGSTAPTVINIKAIAGVTTPATGATPVTTITETAQYTGTVAWSPELENGKFKAATVYTVTITLTAKSGCTLQGVTANFFTVAGATTVTNAANSGTITAVFPSTETATPTGYTVTFNSNGGSTVNPITGLSDGATIAKPADPTRDGYAFSGWYVDNYIFNYPWLFDNYTVTQDITLYAKWSNIHTVTFNSNGGSEISQITGISNGAIITEPEDPTKVASSTTVYIFAGWYKEAGLTNIWNFTSDTVKKDEVLYAKWTEKTTFTLGDIGPGGGKIFYISETGFTFYQNATDTIGITCHYLEAAPANMVTTLAWSLGSDNPNIAGTESNIGTGKKNTALILAIDSNVPAARACNEYTNNGRTDWFLPSYYELYELYKNRTYVEGTGNSRYWTSTQRGQYVAYTLSFSSGSFDYTATNSSKNNANISVRAIRAF